MRVRGWLYFLVVLSSIGTETAQAVVDCKVEFEQLANGKEWAEAGAITAGIHQVDALAGKLALPPTANIRASSWLFGTGYSLSTDEILIASSNHRPEHLSFCAGHERMHQITHFNLRREPDPAIQNWMREQSERLNLGKEVEQRKKSKRPIGDLNRKIESLRKKLRKRDFIENSLSELISNTSTVLMSGNPRIEIELLADSFSIDPAAKKENEKFRDFSHKWDLEAFEPYALSAPRFSSNAPVGYNDPYRTFGPAKYHLWTHYLQSVPGDARRAQILQAVYRASADVMGEEFRNEREHPRTYRIDAVRMNRRLIQHLDRLLLSAPAPH